MGAQYLSAKPIYHATTKHVFISYHFVREKVADGTLDVKHIESSEQSANLLTKALPRQVFDYLKDKLMGTLPLSLRWGIRGVSN